MADDRQLAPAERYEKDMVPAMFRPFAEDLVNGLELGQAMRVADIGCGTGIVARLIAARLDAACTVTGIDINAGMLGVARRCSTQSGCRQEWIEASAEALPFDDGSIDLIVSQHAFMLFPDKDQASREMYRVLRGGGEAHVSVWRNYRHQPHFAALIAALDEVAGGGAAELLKGAFLFESDNAVRALIEGGGFSRVRVKTVTKTVRFPSADDFVRMEVSGSILARMGIEIDDNALAHLSANVSAATREFSSEAGLVVPMEAFVAEASK